MGPPLAPKKGHLGALRGSMSPSHIWDLKRKQGPFLTYRPLDDFGAPSEGSAGPENPTRTFYISRGTFEALLEPPSAPPKCSGAYKNQYKNGLANFSHVHFEKPPGPPERS